MPSGSTITHNLTYNGTEFFTPINGKTYYPEWSLENRLIQFYANFSTTRSDAIPVLHSVTIDWTEENRTHFDSVIINGNTISVNKYLGSSDTVRLDVTNYLTSGSNTIEFRTFTDFARIFTYELEVLTAKFTVPAHYTLTYANETISVTFTANATGQFNIEVPVDLGWIKSVKFDGTEITNYYYDSDNLTLSAHVNVTSGETVTLEIECYLPKNGETFKPDIIVVTDRYIEINGIRMKESNKSGTIIKSNYIIIGDKKYDVDFDGVTTGKAIALAKLLNETTDSDFANYIRNLVEKANKIGGDAWIYVDNLINNSFISYSKRMIAKQIISSGG